MARVIVRKNEPVEKAIKRFKRKVEKEGVMKDLRKKKHYKIIEMVMLLSKKREQHVLALQRDLLKG